MTMEDTQVKGYIAEEPSDNWEARDIAAQKDRRKILDIAKRLEVKPIEGPTGSISIAGDDGNQYSVVDILEVIARRLT